MTVSASKNTNPDAIGPTGHTKLQRRTVLVRVVDEQLGGDGRDEHDQRLPDARARALRRHVLGVAVQCDQGWLPPHSPTTPQALALIPVYSASILLVHTCLLEIA